MKKLFAPWRNNYTTGTAHNTDGTETKDQCVFCTQLQENNDATHFIIRRFVYSAVILNLYPYNAGHLLIIPFEHKGRLHDFSKKARAELMELTTHSTTILTKTLKAPGINVGLNLGKSAGAGIPAHLHMHVLPRWLGDTNFMPTIGQTKIISTDLEEIYKKLKPPFNALPDKL